MPEEKVAALIRSHVQRYSELDIMDVYRLLHQAVFGPGRPLTHVKTEREWLDSETQSATPNPEGILLESVHPEGQIVRLHLRQYLAVHGDLRKLLDAYIDSSQKVHGDASTIAAWWEIFHDLCRPQVGPMANRFDARTISLIGRTRQSENWSAMHHSPPFLQMYKPLYRVLVRPLAEALLTKQKIEYRLV